MNLTITGLTTRLTIANVSDLIMFITAIDDPPVEDISPQPHVKAWLRDRRSAVSAPRCKERKQTD